MPDMMMQNNYENTTKREKDTIDIRGRRGLDEPVHLLFPGR